VLARRASGGVAGRLSRTVGAGDGNASGPQWTCGHAPIGLWRAAGGATGLRKRRRYQRICQNQDYQLEISHAVPLVNTNMGREIGSRATPTRSGRRNRRAQDKRPDQCPAAARSRGTDRTYAFTQLPAPTGFKPMAVESFPAASPDTKQKRPRHGLTSSF